MLMTFGTLFAKEQRNRRRAGQQEGAKKKEEELSSYTRHRVSDPTCVRTRSDVLTLRIPRRQMRPCPKRDTH